MRAERVLAQPVNDKAQAKQQQTTGIQNISAQLRIAERPSQNRVQRLVDLAFSLLKEAEYLARDKSFNEENARVQSMDLTEGIDFYGEVQRFEIGLIKRALEETAGNQARAARLLHIKPTTLNSKIKLYNIQF